MKRTTGTRHVYINVSVSQCGDFRLANVERKTSGKTPLLSIINAISTMCLPIKQCSYTTKEWNSEKIYCAHIPLTLLVKTSSSVCNRSNGVLAAIQLCNGPSS